MALTCSIYDHGMIWPSSVTLTFNLPEKMFRTAPLLLEDNNCANLFWNPCINAPVMARTSSVYDHFDLYLTPMTLTFNLPKMFQMALLLLEDNNCAIVFWNACIYVQVMARKSSIYDHFDLYLTPVSLTFNLPEKLFQMALLLLEDNCANLFWNPCITEQVMVRTSSIYDHFELYLTPVTLTFNLPKNVLNCTSPPRGQLLCKIILKSMHKCTSYGPDKLNIWPFWPLFDPVTLTFNLPKECFKWHFSSSRATIVPNCFEIHALLYKLWSGQIQTDAGTYTNKIVTVMSRLPASGLDKKYYDPLLSCAIAIIKPFRRESLLGCLIHDCNELFS